MSDLRLDDDGYLDMELVDDGTDLSVTQRATADAAIRQAFDVDLAAGWQRRLAGRSPHTEDTVEVQAIPVPMPGDSASGRAHRPRIASRGRVLAVAAVLLAAVAIAGGAMGWFDGDGPATVVSSDPDAVGEADTDANSSTESDDEATAAGDEDDGEQSGQPPQEPVPPSVARTIAVGEGPDTPLDARGYLWVPNRETDTVTRIDPSTGATLEVVVGARPDTGIATADAIWIPVRDAGVLARIDLDDGSVTTIPVGRDADTPVLAADHIWVSVRGSRELVVVSPVTNDVVQRLPLVGRPLTPVLAGDDLWFVTRDDNAAHFVDLTDFDPERRIEYGTVEVGADPDRPLVSAGRIWVPARDQAELTVLDAATRTVVGSVPVGDTPDTPVAGGGLVWVPNAGGTTVTVVDAADLAVVAEIEVGPRPLTGAADASGDVWIPVSNAKIVARLSAATLELVDDTIVGVGPDTPAIIGGSLWVPNSGSASVVEIDLG